ncbi:hypothetical protein AWB74_05202 [Caballeronia arvi]|uniref:Uncharacterized protein n=1 Tax=Caballeronia arvi TaxID=1777135 RepID=A0A158KAU5_9BURK|nr:hypothetical protein AWB74_05202 [Caballeronia arvi]
MRLPPVELVEHASGSPVEAMEVRGQGGQALAYRDVRFAAGPGATKRTRAVIENRNDRVLSEEREDS